MCQEHADLAMIIASGTIRPHLPAQPMSAIPAISVVMPAWNAGPFLGPAIESILGQTFRDFEFIILDDGSTDGTRDRIAGYAKRDPRIRDCPNPANLGYARATKRGFDLARAPWIARMDADDLSYPQRFAHQLAAANRQPDVTLVTCPIDRIVAGGRIVPGWRGVCFQQALLPWYQLFYNRIGGGGQVMLSTRAVRALGGNVETHNDGEDFELWSRLMPAGRVVVLRQPLYAWRSHNPNSTTNRRKVRYTEESLRTSMAGVARSCGVEITLAQAVALRDFWLRYPAAGQDWPAVQRLLLDLARRYRPGRPIPRQAGRLRMAIAGGWFGNAIRAANQRNFPLVSGHLRRAGEAAGWRLPYALARFACNLAAVRGRTELLA